MTMSCFSWYDYEKNLSYDYHDYQYTKGPGELDIIRYTCVSIIWMIFEISRFF